MNAPAARWRGGADWLACAAVALLALAAYLPALDNGFSLDDYNWLARVRFAASRLHFLVEVEPGEIICPVAKAFLACLYESFGRHPRGWHAALLVLHALNAVLVYRVGVRLLGAPGAAFLAACVFAATATGSEAVFWVAASAYPLLTALYLSTLLCFLRHLESGSRASLWGALALFAAGLLVKAVFFTAWAALVVVAFAAGDAGRRRWRSLLPFTALLVAALAANLALGVRHSYLIERGAYAPGWHVATNLAEYLGQLVFPFRALLARLGLAAVYDPLLAAVAVAAPVGFAVAFAHGDRRVRLAVALLALAFVPVLPFVYRPTSRYAYLATVGWAWLVGLLAVRAAGSLGLRPARWLWVVPLLVAPHLAEIVLRDNEYEYRERLMSQLVADVREIYPAPPPGDTITVLDLPNFAIDRGIHFEAALQLAYDDPALVLVAPEPGAVATGDALVYVDGRIHRR
jgi:hypothetical protein